MIVPLILIFPVCCVPGVEDCRVTTFFVSATVPLSAGKTNVRAAVSAFAASR
jgi:hypothetical protein